jgi:Zn-dependent peptidase ImmA (M78 family)
MTWVDHLGRDAPAYNIVMAAVKTCLDENFITSPPVSPIEIASNNGIKVFFAEFPKQEIDVSGFFDFKTNCIYVNKEEPPRRQTFTIAHELGHAILHGNLFRTHPEDYKVLLRTPIGASDDPLEKEANAFAAQLLVPKNMLARYGTIANTSELARLFNVSEDVIRFRLAYESKYAKV